MKSLGRYYTFMYVLVTYGERYASQFCSRYNESISNETSLALDIRGTDSHTI